MKILFALIMWSFLAFCHNNLASAKDKVSVYADANECTLKNKFFCKKWRDAQAFYLTITGDHIFYHDDAEPSKYDCQIVYELTEGENPFSLLKCRYFDSEDKKYYTHYKGFYISDWSRHLDRRSLDFEHITENFSSNLGDICDQGGTKLICDPERGGRGPLSRYK